jgi:hypothetical protein
MGLSASWWQCGQLLLAHRRGHLVQHLDDLGLAGGRRFDLGRRLRSFRNSRDTLGIFSLFFPNNIRLSCANSARSAATSSRNAAFSLSNSS